MFLYFINSFCQAYFPAFQVDIQSTNHFCYYVFLSKPKRCDLPHFGQPNICSSDRGCPRFIFPSLSINKNDANGAEKESPNFIILAVFTGKTCLHSSHIDISVHSLSFILFVISYTDTDTKLRNFSAISLLFICHSLISYSQVFTD